MKTFLLFPSTQDFGIFPSPCHLQDNAVARMHLSGICAQTGRKSEAVALLAEAKKLDKNGMMRDQIKMMQSQLQVTPSKNQMRMAQMMGGRKKTPKMR